MNENADIRNDIPLEEYSSRVDRLNIPLPGFIKFHQTSSESVEDKHFIGREGIVFKLKNWLEVKRIKNLPFRLRYRLTEDRAYTGAYLITGYRGMGKSSFVGKVLFEMTHHFGYYFRFFYYFLLLLTFGIFFLFTFFFMNLEGKRSLNGIEGAWKEVYSFLGESPALIGIVLILIGLVLSFSIYQAVKVGDDFKNIAKKIILFFNPSDVTYIPVKINVGHEVLNDRDMLCLVSKGLYDRFTAYMKDALEHKLYSYISFILKLILSFIIINFVIPEPKYSSMADFDDWISRIFEFILNIPYSIKSFNIYLYNIELFLLVFYIVNVYFENFLSFLVKVSGSKFYNPGYIKDKIRKLNDRIDASVSEGGDISFLNNLFQILFKKRRKEYKQASVQEIEHELISIFNAIERLFPLLRVRFIIVFDELDKVDPDISEKSEQKEDSSIPEFTLSVGGFSGGATTRLRKQRLLNTLASMKYFMSTAKAKFVFIAGRELYDAFLADVSDREFSLSSVFNGVINVNSFFKANAFHSDITSMTEMYICKRLFPFEYITKLKVEKEKGYLIQYYYQYCREMIDKEYRDDPERLEREQKIIVQRIHFLYHFSLYLSHVGNGSPKKIAIHFEKFIRSYEYLSRKKHDRGLLPAYEKTEYYLSFKAEDQFRIGFIHYIAFPIVQVIIRQSEMYGDKLLVSTSFMINHIYKYHNTGFSWRNLEHIPELLEINKTPELRDFIGSIIGFLKQTHLASIVSGLYQFKFPMKITEEISFHSRQSETLSALFNFSLDESLAVKRHYADLLKYYSEMSAGGNRKEFHALASIHHILADIYLADEDYSQAIFEYQNGLQLLSQQIEEKDYDKNSHWPSHMLFFIRCMLKLGLTYEKRKTYNSAYLTYSELVDSLVKFRHLNEKEMGLRFQMHDTNDVRDKYAILFEDTSHSEKFEDSIFKNEVRPELWDGKSHAYSIKSDNLRTELSRLLTPKKSAIIMRLSLFEEIRLVYLSSLAKLFVLEKMNRGGITRTNLEVIESEFFYLHISTNLSEKFLACADFYHKLGTILYYKNGLVHKDRNNLFVALYYWGFDVKNRIDDFCYREFSDKEAEFEELSEYDDYQKLKTLLFDFITNVDYTIFKSINEKDKAAFNTLLRTSVEDYVNKKSLSSLGAGLLEKFVDGLSIPSYISIQKVIKCIEHRKQVLGKGYHLACHACKCYNVSLNVLIDNVLKIDVNNIGQKSKVQVIIENLMILEIRHEWYTLRENYAVLIASNLEGLGNTLVSCSDENDEIREEFLEILFNIAEHYHNKTYFTIIWPSSLSHLEKAILYFWTATSFFNSSRNLNASFRCNKRLLDILCNYVFNRGRMNYIISFLPQIESFIIKRALINIYSHYKHINISEIQKMKWIYGKGVFDNIDLNQLSLFPDIEELLYSFYTLSIDCGDTSKISLLYNSVLMSKHRLVSTLGQDIENLQFKVLMNKTLINRLLPGVTEESIYTGEIPVLFYNALEGLLLEEDIEYLLKDCATTLQVKSETMEDRLEILSFLISDSMYCFSNMLNKINPLTNSTLYTNSFVGNLYRHFLFWNYLFNLLYAFYEGVDSKEDALYIEESPILKKFVKILKDSELHKDKCGELVYSFNRCVNLFRDYRNEKKYGPAFLEKIIDLLGKSNFQMLVNNYLAESARKRYFEAKEMHTEGSTYKDMIGTLYFLDDDLENDTCQFWFALERYKINCGVVDRYIRNLKTVSRFSPIYTPEQYFRTYINTQTLEEYEN